MRLWAYGTGASPHGLGLRERVLVALSPREFLALSDVQQAETHRWAAAQAILVNLHISTDDEPYFAKDFLGIGDRDRRIREREMGRLAAIRENRKLAGIRIVKAGEAEPDDIPAWARMTDTEKAQRGVKHG